MLHHLASRHLAVEISILKCLSVRLQWSVYCFDFILQWLVSWEVSKGLGVFRWQHNMSFYMLRPKRTNSQLCGRLQKNSVFAPFPPLDYIWYTSSRSTSRTCIPKKLWWHTPAPSFFGLLPVVMVTPGSEMAFHSGESSPPPHSLLPSSDQKPHFRQPKILYLPHTVLFKRACRLQGSSHWQDLYAVAAWRRPVRYQAMSGLLVQMSPCCTDLFLLHWKKAWVSDEQQTALCSTSVVKSQLSLRESRWLQQSKKKNAWNLQSKDFGPQVV